MWAQLITMTIKDGKADELPGLFDKLHASEQEGSGLLRTLTMVDQANPNQLHTLVLFESEEKARAREADPRRDAGLADVRALMGELFDGPPTFTNLDVIHHA
jgi:hypothetical protein